MIKTKLEELNLLDKFLFDEAMEDREIYQTQLDVSLLGPGSTDFNFLNESCFILIAPFDIFGRGLYRYTFEGVCRECPDLKLEDGALRVFINTKGKNREDFSEDLSRCISSGDTSKERSVCESLDFMEYIGKTTDETAGNTESLRIREIHEKVKRIRKSEKAGLRLMQKWEELAYEREDGMAVGIIKTALEYGAMTEEISGKLQKILQISPEEAQKYLESYLEKN